MFEFVVKCCISRFESDNYKNWPCTTIKSNWWPLLVIYATKQRTLPFFYITIDYAYQTTSKHISHKWISRTGTTQLVLDSLLSTLLEFVWRVIERQTCMQQIPQHYNPSSNVSYRTIYCNTRKAPQCDKTISTMSLLLQVEGQYFEHLVN